MDLHSGKTARVSGELEHDEQQLTDGVPCHHDAVLVGAFSDEYASPKVATVGDTMGRSVSSVLMLDRLRRGDEGADEYGDSFCDTCRRSMTRE